MAEEPESRNEISGQVSGHSVQAGRIEGGVHFHGQVPAEEKPVVPPPPRDRWLMWTGIVTMALPVVAFIPIPRLLGWPPLFGTGGMVLSDDPPGSLPQSLLYWLSWAVWGCFAVWQLSIGGYLVTRRSHRRGREQHTAQIALSLSLIPGYVAVGAPFGWVLLFLLAAGLGVCSLVRGPHALVPERVGWSVLAGIVAALTWAPIEVITLWNTNAPVAWRVAGMLLLLPIVAVPVYAVLTFPGWGAARVLYSWMICFFAKFAVTLLTLWENWSAVPSKLAALGLPVVGWIAMLSVLEILQERAPDEDA